MLRVVPGMPMDGRGERLLREALAGESSRAHLHVVRTRARERQLQELERATAGGRFGSTVVRLSDFVRRLAPKRTRFRASLGDAQRSLMLDEIARDEARPPLRGVAGLAGWLGRLFSVLKQGDVFSVDRAFAQFRSLDPADPGCAEALRLFGLYQARLVELRLYDDDGLYLEVARDLGTAELPFDRLMPARRRLVVEGFYQTNVVERAIFEKLFSAFDETVWLVDLGSGTPADAFGVGVLADRGRLPGDLAWLAARGGEEASLDAPAAPDGSFRWPLDFGATRPGGAGSVDWFWTPEIARRTELSVASDERTEARFLAERAAAIVRSDPDASVVIAYPSDRDAAALLQEACADVSLPLEVAAWRTLAECAPARTLLNLLGLGARDFPRDRVVAALRGAGSGIEAGGVRLTAALVDRVSRRAGVISGAAEWRRKLLRLASRLERELAAETEDDVRERLDRELGEAADVSRGIDAVIESIPRADGRSTFEEFVAAVRVLIGRFGIDRVELVPRAGLAPESIEALATSARTRRALDSVLETYERSGALLWAEPRSWSDHVAALGALIDATIVPFAPSIRRGATLVGIRELRGLVTDHLLVGGLTEDAFPGASEPVPLLSEDDAARAGARTSESRRREAAHLLVQALHSPRKSLTLSRSEQRQGCDALPALALLPILSRADVRERNADEALLAEPALGRATRGRQAAAALSGAATAAAGASALLAEIRGSGPGGEHAWHRLQAERERFDPARVGRFEGMLEDAALPLILEDQKRLVVSPTRLEDYAKCPELFFFKRVLRLGAPEDADPDVTPIERGSVIHRILYRFHTAQPDGGRPEQAALLGRIAREELQDLRTEGLFADVFAESLLRDLELAGASDRPGLLRAYLDKEESRRSTLRPAFFEARFGKSPYGGRSETLLSVDPLPLFRVQTPGGELEVFLTGSIDRVDVQDVGSRIDALVIDYKTGEVQGNKRKALKGILFQLPLYSAMVPRMLEPTYGSKPVRTIGAVYYQIKSVKDLGIKEQLIDESDKDRVKAKWRAHGLPDGQFDVLLRRSVEHARDVIAGVVAGKFHPTGPTGFKSACEMCDFSLMCRGKGEATRLGRMSDAGLFAQAVDLIGVGDAEKDE